MAAWYNEIDEHAAQWLRNLIAAGHIADGVVDTRSISEVSPDDIKDFKQCHFFAGIGVWSLALRTAGWPDDRPVWTGSCPCTPFSVAGRSAGFADERHLWPHWHHLIRECRPRVIFGEQVASGAGLDWLDLVHADLEGEGYAVGAVDLCAAGVGAPHIRQRLWFVAEQLADADVKGLEGRPGLRQRADQCVAGASRVAERLADADDDGLDRQRLGEILDRERAALGDDADGRGALRGVVGAPTPAGARSGPTNGFWRDVDWIFCRDGKWRPAQPGVESLAHGTPGRVGQLRAYGNAIVAPLASEVIRAYLNHNQLENLHVQQPKR